MREVIVEEGVRVESALLRLASERLVGVGVVVLEVVVVMVMVVRLGIESVL